MKGPTMILYKDLTFKEFKEEIEYRAGKNRYPTTLPVLYSYLKKSSERGPYFSLFQPLDILWDWYEISIEDIKEYYDSINNFNEIYTVVFIDDKVALYTDCDCYNELKKTTTIRTWKKAQRKTA